MSKKKLIKKFEKEQESLEKCKIKTKLNYEIKRLNLI